MCFKINFIRIKTKLKTHVFKSNYEHGLTIFLKTTRVEYTCISTETSILKLFHHTIGRIYNFSRRTYGWGKGDVLEKGPKIKKPESMVFDHQGRAKLLFKFAIVLKFLCPLPFTQFVEKLDIGIVCVFIPFPRREGSLF